MDINPLFAYLTHPDGTHFQVLTYDEDGNITGTDDAAMAEAYAAHKPK